jgi:hypothetical protein
MMADVAPKLNLVWAGRTVFFKSFDIASYSTEDRAICKELISPSSVEGGNLVDSCWLLVARKQFKNQTSKSKMTY